MKGYSKIATEKSRSIDFSDLFSFPQTPKTKRSAATAPPTAKHHHHHQDDEDEDEERPPPPNPNPNKKSTPEAENNNINGERLGRSGSVSSANTSFQATMKRAFSMRRSSSVSEKYCRIHDQFMAITTVVRDDDDDDMNTTIADHHRSNNNKGERSGKKILRACKRLLRL